MKLDLLWNSRNWHYERCPEFKYHNRFVVFSSICILFIANSQVSIFLRVSCFKPGLQHTVSASSRTAQKQAKTSKLRY